MGWEAGEIRRGSRAYAVGAVLGCACMVAAGAAQVAPDLTTLSLEQLLGLTVVGASKYEQKQSEVAAAVKIITRDEIRSFGWRTLGAALASLPGMSTTYDRQYGYIGVRGFGLPGDYNTRVLIMIDGNRVNDAVYDGGPSDRSFPLDMALVERIEFIPGPGGAVYGQNAMLGVVNVITRSGEAMGGLELAAGAQSPQRLAAGRASWGRRLDNGLDLALSMSGLHAGGENLFFDFGAAGVAGVARGLDGEQVRQVFAKASRGPWSLALISGDRRKDDPAGAYLSDPLVPGSSQRDRYTLAQAQVQDSFFGGTLEVQARLFAGQLRYSGASIYDTAYRFPTVGDWRGIELRGLYLGVAGHKLMAGLEWQDNTRVVQQAIDLAEPSNNLSISSPGSRLGIYAQDEWRLSATLATTLGLRVDRGSATGHRTSPRAALIWQTTPATTLKALYGRAYRAPNSAERDYDDGVSQVGNPALRGERIDTLELVADHRVASNLQLRGTLYRWTMRDLITLGIDPVSGLPQYRSGGDVEASGVELSADQSWAWGGRLRSSVSWQRLRQDTGARLPNSPQVLGKLDFSAPLPVAGLRMGYELRVDGPRLTLDGSDAGGYAVSNLRLSTNVPGWDLDIGVTVRNLFDKRYAHPGADTNWQNTLAQDGRSVAIDAQLRF